MAKILMMAGSTVVVLSLLGFLVLLLKGRAVTKTSPVLMSLKALGIRPSEAEQRLCRQRVWVGNDTLMTPREQHFFRALLRHTSRKRWLLCPQVRVADIATLSPHIGVLGIFRPKTTKCSGGRAVRGLQRGITFR